MGQSPSAACRSVWQTPLATTSTSACPCPGSGIGTSRIFNGSPKVSTKAACIVFAMICLLRVRSLPVDFGMNLYSDSCSGLCVLGLPSTELMWEESCSTLGLIIAYGNLQGCDLAHWLL